MGGSACEGIVPDGDAEMRDCAKDGCEPCCGSVR
jgi:hypothetical protein